MNPWLAGFLGYAIGRDSERRDPSDGPSGIEQGLVVAGSAIFLAFGFGILDALIQGVFGIDVTNHPWVMIAQTGLILIVVVRLLLGSFLNVLLFVIGTATVFGGIGIGAKGLLTGGAVFALVWWLGHHLLPKVAERIQDDVDERRQTAEDIGRIKSDAYDFITYRQRAVAKRRQGDLPGAISDYGNAIRLADVTIDYEMRADAKIAIGDLDGAITDYDIVVSRQSREFKSFSSNANIAYAKRAMTRMEEGKLGDAIADLDRSIELYPTSDLYDTRAKCNLLAGDIDAAISDMTHSLELQPKDERNLGPLLFMRGVLQFVNGNWAAAGIDLGQSCGMQHEYRLNSSLFLWLARTRIGKGELANEELLAAIAEPISQSDEKWLKATASMLLGNTSEEDYFSSIHENEMNEARFFVAMKKLFSGDRVDSSKIFRELVLLDSGDGAWQLDWQVETIAVRTLAAAELDRIEEEALIG